MSNQSYVQKGKLALLSLFAIAIGGLISCSSPVDSILKESPALEVGNQTLTILVERADQSALDSFELTINGTTETYTSQEVIVSDVTSGTYVVSVAKEGFSGKEKDIVLDVPTDESTDFSAELSLTLTKLNDPTPVTSAGTTITVDPIGNGASGAGSSTTEVVIPAGAIPEGTTIDVGVTPIPVDPDEESGTEGVATVSYQFEPAGQEFDVPITITIPLDLTQAQIDANLPVQFEYPATGETVPVTVSADGQTGTVEIDHFSIWAVAFPIELTITDGTRTRSFSSECGGALSESAQFSGTYGNLFQSLFPNVTGTVSINAPVQQAAQELFIATGKVTATTLSYTITFGNLTLERVNNIPLSSRSFAVEYAFVECHDSGG